MGALGICMSGWSPLERGSRWYYFIPLALGVFPFSAFASMEQACRDVDRVYGREKMILNEVRSDHLRSARHRC